MSASAREQIPVTLVRSPACHLCEDALVGLTALAGEFGLVVEVVECIESRGSALVRQHRPAMFPLVLVSGAFFSCGRLPVKKLRMLLTSRLAGAVA